MTGNASFVRKVGYVIAIALLLIPLSIMSRPKVVRKTDLGQFEPQQGGILAEMRADAGLSQAELGQIDPASATMKLATFGLRGVAVAILWDRAQEHKKKENWDNFSAALEQIARLQPNFVTVWEYQAHNMSYNTSVEFDDYRQRYHWVKKGIDYLITGTEYNRNEPRLLWYAGWVIGQKMGRADERVQFRRMFRDDSEFHTVLARQGIDIENSKGADGKPDNWLMGRQWYFRAQEAADNGASIGGKSPAVFHSSPTKSLMNYLEDSEKEIDFDEAFVQSGWIKADGEWRFGFGARLINTSAGFRIQLNKVEELEQEISDLKTQLDALLPGAREQVRQDKIAALSADKRKAWEKPESERSSTDRVKAGEAESTIAVTHHEVAQKAPTEKSLQARRLANQLLLAEEKLRYTHISRGVVHYEFWRDRALAGATKLNSAARKNLAEARRLFTKPDLEGAKEKFETSFKQWAEIHEKWPTLKDDAENTEIVEGVEAYIKVLEQLDLRDEDGNILPPDFPLVELMKANGKEDLLRFRSEPKSETEEKPPTATEEKPEAEKESEASPPPSEDPPKEETADATSPES